MIISNGTVEPLIKTPGGISAQTGYPVASVSSWGNPIPCQFVPVRHDNLSMPGGVHHTEARWSILIELCRLGSEQLRLKDRDGCVIGEYSVISAEPLEAVDQLRITV